ncbi:cation transporter [Oceanobacter mangrovi]|uniref:cation transporter n=1 Tax=Oceanobacter mangrovi TaxID=2862510 RepID=UPI001C8DCF34|nr:cation transporter [Oceanobacter mangrovi]
MSGCCGPSATDQSQKTLLWTVLLLNAAMFVVEFGVGWLARSSGLMADSLDMLADALVYGMSLYAVGRGNTEKARAALMNGSFQLALGIGVLLYVVWRITQNEIPAAETMGVIAVLALIVNAACFGLLWKSRSGDINLRSSWICSRNDMIANVGVLVAAGLVTALNSPWPDWIIATLVAIIVIRSALRIIREARHSLATGEEVSISCCGSDSSCSTPAPELAKPAASSCCGTVAAEAVAAPVSSCCGGADKAESVEVKSASSCCGGAAKTEAVEVKAESSCCGGGKH